MTSAPNGEKETEAEEGSVAGAAVVAGLGALWGLGILSGVNPGIGPAIAGGTLGVLLSSCAIGRPSLTLSDLIKAASRVRLDDRMSDQLSTVFFDGTCGVCDQTVDLLMRLDHRKRLTFAPIQGETARRILPAQMRLNPQSVVVQDGDELLQASAAVVRIIWRLSGVWRIVAGMLWLVPAPLRDAIYRFVARNRYRILGKKTTCRLPTPDQAKQLLP